MFFCETMSHLCLHILKSVASYVVFSWIRAGVRPMRRQPEVLYWMVENISLLLDLAAWSPLKLRYTILCPLWQILLSSIHLINIPRYLLLGVSIYVSAASRKQKFPLPSPPAIKIDFSNSLFTKKPVVNSRGNGRKRRSQS